MSVTVSNELRIGMRFADRETRTYAIPNLPNASMNPTQARTRIQELNKVIGGASSSDTLAQTFGQAMTQTFISADGSDPDDDTYPVTQIYSCTFVSKSEEVVYSG